MSYAHGPDVLTTSWAGPFPSHEAAVQHGRSRYGTTKSFYVTKVDTLRLDETIPNSHDLVKFLLDELWLAGFKNHGDHADSFPDADDVSLPAKEELHAFVKSWVQRRLRPGFVPTGSPQRIEPLTQLTLVEHYRPNKSKGQTK